MRIIFMGTPDFAVPSLQKITTSRHKVIAVVTAPDKEKGRGQKVSITPVKEYALVNNIPILQPDKLKDPEFIKSLKELAADLIVVVAFRILPREVFSIPQYGSFNLHGSLLPKYRGAAPIQWAIINGEKETGITTFALEDKVDTGNYFLEKKIMISDEDNFGVIHDKLSILGADAVLETIEIIDKGNYVLQNQDDSLATPAPKITKETGLIEWNKPAHEINNLIRGLSPYPGAYFLYKDKFIKIYKSSVDNDKVLKPGEIFSAKEELIIGCRVNSLRINELQLEGKKRMSVIEFLRGFSFS
jgi:methionyl-tRNA formyltransferase